MMPGTTGYGTTVCCAHGFTADASWVDPEASSGNLS